MKKIVTLLVLVLGTLPLFAQTPPAEGRGEVRLRLHRAYGAFDDENIVAPVNEMSWRFRSRSEDISGNWSAWRCITVDRDDEPAYSDNTTLDISGGVYDTPPRQFTFESESWEDDCGDRCVFDDDNAIGCFANNDDDYCNGTVTQNIRSWGPPCQWNFRELTFPCSQNGWERRGEFSAWYSSPTPSFVAARVGSEAPATTFCNGQNLTIEALRIDLPYPLEYRWEMRERFQNQDDTWSTWSPWMPVVDSTASFDMIANSGRAAASQVEFRVKTFAGCESQDYGFSPTLTIVREPQAPQVENLTLCASNYARFTVNAPGIDGAQLYDRQQNLVDEVLRSPYILETRITGDRQEFTVRTKVGSCTSAPAPVTAEVRPHASIPFAPDVRRCGVGAVTFTAMVGPGESLVLYDQAFGGSPVATSSSSEITSPPITTDTFFYLEAQNLWGCPSRTRMPVYAQVNVDPAQPITAADIERCGPGEFTFTVQTSGPVELYTQPFGGEPVDVSTLSPFTLETPLVQTTTTFYIQARNTECAGARTPVVARITESFQIDAGRNTFVDCGSGVLLSAQSGADAYRWAPVESLSDPSSRSTMATPTQTTTYTVTATRQGCQSVDTVIVNVRAPELQVQASRNSICAGQSTDLSLLSNLGQETSYTWAPSTGLNTTFGTRVTAQPQQTTTYTVNSSGRNCAASATITVTVHPLPRLSGQAIGPEVTLDATDGTPPYVYSLDGTNFQQSPVFENLPPRTYIAHTRDRYGCAATAVVTVQNCEPPANLRASAAGDVQWDGDPQGRYLIQYRQDGGDWSVERLITGTSYQISGVAGAVEVRVRRSCRLNVTSTYVYTTFVIENLDCQEVTEVQVSDITSSTAFLSWQPAPGATAYRVELQRPPNNWQRVGEVTTPQLRLNGLESYTDYNVRIRTLCGNQEGADALTSFRTRLRCNAPEGLRASDLTSTSARITWIPYFGAEGYLLSWREQGSSIQRTLNAFSPHFLRNLQPSTTYVVKVRSKCDPNLPLPDGLSFWSDEIEFTTPANRSAAGSAAAGISIYPNPSTGVFTLNPGQLMEESAELEVFDVTGVRVLYQAFVNGLSAAGYTFELEGTGLYTLRLQVGGQILTRKLIVR